MQELQLLSSRAITAESHALEPEPGKPQQWEARAPQLEGSHRLLQLEESLHSNKDPEQSKINKKNFLSTKTLKSEVHFLKKKFNNRNTSM